jgi:MraZ protein
MKLFLGEYDHVLDDRGRVTLPRKLRQELGRDEVVLSRGFDACIFGFDREQWEKEAAKHIETALTDEESRKIRRYLFAAAENTEVDRLGRIIVPTQLKEYANIGKEVVVVGAGDHFEIWDKAEWKKYQLTTKTP